MRKYGFLFKVEDNEQTLRQFDDLMKNYKRMKDELNEAIHGPKKSKKAKSSEKNADDNPNDILASVLEPSRDRFNKTKVVRALENGEKISNDEIL